jgi:Kef-type K+ transport system membrane component KefB
VKIDQPINVVALLGLVFLLFPAGLEIELRAVTPSQLRAPLAGYASSLLLGTVAASPSTSFKPAKSRMPTLRSCHPAGGA